MSYDLRVATHSRPEPRQVEELAHERGASVESDDPLLVRRGNSRFEVEVWRAVKCEIDDLDDELAAAVLAPRWLTEISIPHGAPRADVSLARTIARGLAEACDGAALDPQEDGLLWPRGRVPRYRPPAKEDRIPVLNLTWILTARGADDLPERWLRILQRRVPEAAPVRYGDFEPLQERLEAGQEPAFVDFWREHQARVFWSCQRPFYGGSFSAPDERARERGEPGVLAAALRTELDARALEEAPWREAVVDLFTNLADEVEAVYAAAYVERDVLASVRGLAYDGRSEAFSDFTPLRHRWLGVPPVPAWLSWFGPEYGELLRGVGERFGSGILLRVGERPRGVSEVGREFPQLPPEILAAPGREGAAPWLPAE